MKDHNDRNIPTYIKYFYVVGSITLTFFILFVLNFLVAPLLAAAVVAILLIPITERLERLRIPKILCSTISVMLFFIGILFFIGFLTSQFSFLAADPFFSIDSISSMINNFQNWISSWSDIHIEKFRFSSDFIKNVLKEIAAFFPGALIGTANYITMFVLFFFGLFFFLYYRLFFLSFIYKLFDQKNHDQVKKTLEKINEAVKSYIVGLFIVITIVALLNSIGLLFLGISHAIFFGVMAAILTIIPYIGIMIGAVIAALYALITYDSLWYPIGVMIVLSIVQFLEGNVITPNIIGQKENINPFIAILGLFIGEILLGLVGVILAIPLLGILKIICDDFPHLKPLSYVMGYPQKNHGQFQNFFYGLIKKLRPNKRK